jgi:hypothetical protein
MGLSLGISLLRQLLCFANEASDPEQIEDSYQLHAVCNSQSDLAIHWFNCMRRK